ncbi:hypothetical protein SZN_09241 [Streptomyces zinciresistens K42]|uniref:Uncharacterized protein n=1 Tax=Streptomyces zinciresistens K42 TaxID=700597 RepID=G2G8N0_9ACTN|nr:hypothetical protein [Streptomyces zinciresistens]EGX60095.1 hypothetical protein SZN_09241 [Streptomyces zinciresistens K42]
MPYDLGATARLNAECRDPAGALVTAGSAVVTVTLPDGTTVTPDSEQTATAGLYQADYVTQVAGRHTVRWLFAVPAHAYTDSFDVRDEAPPTVLSLQDAKTLLKKQDSRDDPLVRFWLEASTRAVEHFVGPVVVRTVTEDHQVGRVTSLALRKAPVLSLLSVTSLHSGGGGYAPDTLHLDPVTGAVTRRDGGQLTGPLQVVYRAGRPVVPANILAGAQLILQHLWRTAAGPGRPQRGTDDFDVTEPIPGLGYAIPNRAVQMLSPDDDGPGIA